MHASQVSHQDDRYAEHQMPGLACLDDFGLMLNLDLQNRHPGWCIPEGGDFRDPALNIKPIHRIRHFYSMSDGADSAEALRASSRSTCFIMIEGSV